ncbi:carbon catabolite repressor protein [Culex quinquefasciatus]|uniref:poly(A)-specific ribonuclease n=1 Tax=Culex quinquefasciatus TaxID=7176 RepID=B0WDL0_CULQU|nr:carbon catabolite repressor protein [Culex quinquefasciatus]|eukprot:XP_001846794.1 carbon catabolite repressor protein [Culex quinquefasciatus]
MPLLLSNSGRDLRSTSPCSTRLQPLLRVTKCSRPPQITKSRTCHGHSPQIARFDPNRPRIVSVAPPPQRPWIPLARPNRSRGACIFTVMCYNVLCDKYATRQMYGYCPSWALSWEYRKKAILDEIRHYSADIISLQEVETDQFFNFFKPELKNDGYEGIFSPKSRAKTMSESDRKYVDGCAIFFRSSKFSLIKETLVEFNQLAMANAEGSDNMLNRVMPKDNIGLAALLKVKESAWEGLTVEQAAISQPILVCTAHIHWDPEFCDVKLIQTMMLSNEIKTILDEASHSFRPGHKYDTNNVQLVLCGDFNSLPDSGVIEFLSAGRVSMDHQDFKELGYKSCLQRIIDYIFYSKQGMVPLGLLGPISGEWLRENKVVGCPHPHIPSDHFPLLVELELIHMASNQNGLIGRR